jgi:SAM-dependent methyltransferase
MMHSLVLLLALFGGDDGFRWPAAESPSFSWPVSEEKGGDQSIVVEKDSPSSGSGAIGPLYDQVAPESSNPAIAPTSHEAIQFALSMYRGVLPQHTFVDIGCGDGRVLIAAVRKFNCNGLGIEIDPDQAELARRCVEAAGLSHKITIREGDATQMDFKADAGFAYLYPETLEALADKIAAIPAFVSYQHPVDGLKETRTEHGSFYSKDPQAVAQSQPETKVVPAAPYAVWNGVTYYQEYRPGCQCDMCRSLRAQLAIPRTTTVVVQPEQQAAVMPQINVSPQRTGRMVKQCINGVCQWVWVWDQ